MISRDEARQIRGVAEMLRGRPSPAQLELVASMLDQLVAGGARSVEVDDRQCQLRLDQEPAPEPVNVAPAAPSSSDLLFPKGKKKKTEPSRVRPNTDDPIPHDFRAVYDQVLAERRKTGPLELPSAEFVWAKFVEDAWAKDISFAKRWNMKRSWRSWAWWEHGVAVGAQAVIPAEVAPATCIADELVEERRATAEVRGRRGPDEIAKTQASLSLLFASLPGASAPPAPAPEPRSLSA